MDDDELFQLQLDAAIAESLAEQPPNNKDSVPTAPIPQQDEMTAEELAFFTDAELPSFREKREDRSQIPSSTANGFGKSESNLGFGSIPPSRSTNPDFRSGSANPSTNPDNSSSLRPPSSTSSKPDHNKSGAASLDSFWSTVATTLGFTPGQAVSKQNTHTNPAGSTKNSAISLLGMPQCQGCQQAITFGKYIVINGDHYHEQCFRCMGCGELMETGAVSYRGDNGLKLPYHPKCAVELFNPRCCLCNHAIDGRFMKHSYFEGEVYCTTHAERNTCFACGRKEPLPESNRDRFVDLLDGRSLCAVCSGSVIMDSSEAALIYQEVLHFFAEGLQLPVPAAMRTVPILAVDIYTLNERLRKEQDINAKEHEGHNGSTIRGLTLSTIGEIQHFTRSAPSSSSTATAASSKGGLNGFLSQLSSIQYRIEEVRDVTAILVLYGLPRDLFASILAHEAMHAWCKLTKSFPFHLPPKVEEGMCQLVSYKFLEHLSNSQDVHSRNEDNEEQQQRAFFRHQIATDTSVVYGDGFREAQKIEAALGLAVMLEVVAEAKDFPVI